MRYTCPSSFTSRTQWCMVALRSIIHTPIGKTRLFCVFSALLLSLSDSLLLQCCPPMLVSDNINDFLLDLLADTPGSSLYSTLVDYYWVIMSTGQMEKGSTRLQLQANPLYEHVPGCTLITPAPRWSNLCPPSWSDNTGQEDELVMTQAQNRWWLSVSMLLKSYKGETLSMCL